MTLPAYEVYAIKYAERATSSHGTFIFKDLHDAPMDMDYFVWAISGGGKTYVVDLGFDRRYERGSRHLLRTPAEGLDLLGVNPAEVEDVIVTHMHYDHAGSMPDFPQAKFHIQEDEMAFATGRHLRHKAFRYGNFVEYTVDFVHAVYDDRVIFTNGEGEIAPGMLCTGSVGTRTVCKSSASGPGTAGLSWPRCRPHVRQYGTAKPLSSGLQRL